MGIASIAKTIERANLLEIFGFTLSILSTIFILIKRNKFVKRNNTTKLLKKETGST